MKVRAKPIATAVATLSIVVLVTGIGCTQDQAQRYEGPVEKITVGAGKTAVLVYVAEDQGFFRENGLDVEIVDFQAGKLAADALLAGEVDVATAACSVLVSHGFERDDLRTLGTIATTQVKELVARRDHGINKISDLENKRIGVTMKSEGEFGLGRFLTYNQLGIQDIQTVDLTPKEIVEAMVSGEIDAAMAWEPHVYNMKQSLGDNLVSWPGDSDQDSYFVLLSKQEWVEAHSSVIERFLTALVQAEEFVESNSGQVQRFLEQRFDYEPAYLQSVWPKYAYAVRFPQALILFMEDEARWRISNNLTDKEEMPNYLDFLYLNGLEAVKPEAVTIIR